MKISSLPISRRPFVSTLYVGDDGWYFVLPVRWRGVWKQVMFQGQVKSDCPPGGKPQTPLYDRYVR